jgi:hypothetical protein
MDRCELRELKATHDAAFERALAAARAYLAGVLEQLPSTSPEFLALRRENAAAHDAYLVAARRWRSA